MGLTAWKGDRPRKSDVTVAKNYLSEEELGLLNLIVNQYLDFAELRARRRQQMTMKEWAAKLDDFLTLNDMEILVELGKVSKKMDDGLAHGEFDKYKEEQRLVEDQKAVEALEREARKLIGKPVNEKKSKKTS